MNDAVHLILKQQRQHLCLTQQQVADRAEIKIQQYQKFESGERSILSASFLVAGKVITALEMDLTDFFYNKYTVEEDNENG